MAYVVTDEGNGKYKISEPREMRAATGNGNVSVLVEIATVSVEFLKQEIQQLENQISNAQQELTTYNAYLAEINKIK